MANEVGTAPFMQRIADLSEQVLGRILLADGPGMPTPRQIARELRFNEMARLRSHLPLDGLDVIQCVMWYMVPPSDR